MQSSFRGLPWSAPGARHPQARRAGRRVAAARAACDPAHAEGCFRQARPSADRDRVVHVRAATASRPLPFRHR